MNAAEYRALGQLMRWARAQGYTYHVTTYLGATDWSWGKGGKYAVVAEPMSTGWLVKFNDSQGNWFPESVQQLTDVLVAVGLLPIGFRSPAPAAADDCGCRPNVPGLHLTACPVWVNVGPDLRNRKYVRRSEIAAAVTA